MGETAPRAPVGGWGPQPPQKFGHAMGSSLLGNRYQGPDKTGLFEQINLLIF